MTRFDNATPETNIRNTAVATWSEDGFIWKMLVICGLAYLVWSDRVSIEFKVNTPGAIQASIFGATDSPAQPVKRSKADKQKTRKCCPPDGSKHPVRGLFRAFFTDCRGRTAQIWYSCQYYFGPGTLGKRRG